VAYQPIFSNWDNDGVSRDNLGPWRNRGVTSINIVSGSTTGYLSTSEGASGSALSDYGRISFAMTGTNSSSFNVLSAFRHTNGSGNAPTGSWMRISGNFGTLWPQSGDSAWTTDDHNRVLRGVVAAQYAPMAPGLFVHPGTNPLWIPGASDVPIFRQAVLLSDLPIARTIDIYSEQSSLDRVGQTVEYPRDTEPSDNRRYMTWRTQTISTSPFGDFRSGVEIIPAQIIISPYIPAPSAAALLGLGGMFAVRRRR
jgi:hypothetical protein